jgi:hypothetical protein
MAKERLSKLQKWILEQSYKLNILHDGSVVGCASCVFYLRGPDYKHWGEYAYQYFEHWIYEKYYCFRYWHGDGFTQTPEYNKVHVTVCRSVRNMEEKGLIIVDYIFGSRNLKITEKGVEILEKSCK